MRKPLTKEEVWAWWRAAIAGNNPPIHLNDPQAGFFVRRLVRGGPWVPCRIWLEQEIDEDTGELISEPVFRCLINGKPADASDQWSWLAGHPITEKQFRAMTGTSDAPAAVRSEEAALKKIDWSALPPPKFEETE